MKYVKIPASYNVGGAKIEVRRVERCDDNSLGICLLAGGYVEIANRFSKDEAQSDYSKVNTFYHELTHSILDTMGEKELSSNERFVCTFSSFLAEAMSKAYFEEEDEWSKLKGRAK